MSPIHPAKIIKIPPHGPFVNSSYLRHSDITMSAQNLTKLQDIMCDTPYHTFYGKTQPHNYPTQRMTSICTKQHYLHQGLYFAKTCTKKTLEASKKNLNNLFVHCFRLGGFSLWNFNTSSRWLKTWSPFIHSFFIRLIWLLYSQRQVRFWNIFVEKKETISNFHSSRGRISKIRQYTFLSSWLSWECSAFRCWWLGLIFLFRSGFS